MVQVGPCPGCQKEVALSSASSTDGDAPLRCPHCEQEFAHAALSLRDIPELILAGAAADATAHESTTAASQTIELQLGSADANANEDVEIADTSPIDMPVVTPSWSGQDYDAQISAEPRAVPSGGSRTFLRQLVGVVGGGVIGLVMGYYVLLWIGGPQKDFLEIGRHLPRWAVPAAFHPIEQQRDFARDDAGRSLADLLDSNEEDALFGVPVAEPKGLPPEPPFGEPDLSPDITAADVAVVDPPTLTTADLDAAYRTAADVRLSLVAGETSDPALRPLKEAAYQAFAVLAEAVTYAAPTPGRELEHATFLMQAEQLLMDTLANERMMEQLGPLAETWLAAADRDTAGFVVSGVVIGSHMGIEHQRGILIEPVGTSRALAVVGPHGIDVPRGTRVVVVGSLIDEPQQRIRGYTGSAEQVVWARLVLQ